LPGYATAVTTDFSKARAFQRAVAGGAGTTHAAFVGPAVDAASAAGHIVIIETVRTYPVGQAAGSVIRSPVKAFNVAVGIGFAMRSAPAYPLDADFVSAAQ